MFHGVVRGRRNICRIFRVTVGVFLLALGMGVFFWAGCCEWSGLGRLGKGASGEKNGEEAGEGGE